MPSSHLVRQSSRAVLRAVVSEKSVVVLVRQGSKSVLSKDTKLTILSGSVGVLPARMPLTIENKPNNGCYIASAILLDEKQIEESAIPPGVPTDTSRDDRTVAAFERAVIALDDPLTPSKISEHAVREALLWLAEAGIGFGPTRPIGFVDRLRSHIAAEPDVLWRSAEAARGMAVSEATMRRKLAAEGTTFGDLLADVRMTQALGLLQTTELPINRIALDVGYSCPSRFAQRFRARFGVVPSAIRASRHKNMTASAH